MPEPIQIELDLPLSRFVERPEQMVVRLILMIDDDHVPPVPETPEEAPPAVSMAGPGVVHALHPNLRGLPKSGEGVVDEPLACPFAGMVLDDVLDSPVRNVDVGVFWDCRLDAVQNEVSAAIGTGEPVSSEVRCTEAIEKEPLGYTGRFGLRAQTWRGRNWRHRLPRRPPPPRAN